MLASFYCIDDLDAVEAFDFAQNLLQFLWTRQESNNRQIDIIRDDCDYLK